MKLMLGLATAAFLLLAFSAQAAELRISTDNLAIPGEWSEVSVTAAGVTGPVKSFSLSLALTQSRYAVVDIAAGADVEACDWEYFTYRVFRQDSIPEYDLRDAGHLLTVTAMAGVGGCYPTGADMELLNLRLLLDYETTSPFASVACTFQPLRFYWRNCTDNILYEAGEETVLAATRAIDPANNDTLTVQGYTPPQGPCAELDPAVYSQTLDAVNGGMDFACTDTLSDGRGDINLNGRPYEIADVILYNCAFLYGMGCFDVNVIEQVLQSDVNRDGYPLSVADIVFMMRLMTHEIMPVDRLSPTAPSATIAIEQNGPDQHLVMNGDQSVAGLYVKLTRSETGGFEGIAPIDNDLLQVGRIGDTATILLVDTETGGDVLAAGRSDLGQLPGEGWEIAGVEAVASSGAKFNVDFSRALPTTPLLLDNYPNPFNPNTTIVFSLAQQSAWTVSIYDVMGRSVQTLSGIGQGRIAVDWNGADDRGAAVSSGVYFYRLEANGKRASQKMLLLK